MTERAFLVIRNVVYVCAFMLLWLWLVPRWIGLRTSLTFPSDASARWLGVLPLILGASLLIYCFAHFIVAGRGTVAPFDAPRRLVISGPYLYVRNPIYVGAGLFLGGCAILFAEFSMTLLWYAVGLIVIVNLLVRLYEEPTLRRKFDGDYEEYCRHVSRWLPRRPSSRPASKTAGAKL
jgi:protein-S-isoprenylcysteine O-methyltransferase Ste14